jgi:hypothetical protein
MASHFPRLSFEHREPLGRPSCPKCGQLCLFPESMQYASGRVCNGWQCDGCTLRFQTSVAMTSDTDRSRAVA